jgi:hypothetical protein
MQDDLVERTADACLESTGEVRTFQRARGKSLKLVDEQG